MKFVATLLIATPRAARARRRGGGGEDKEASGSSEASVQYEVTPGGTSRPRRSSPRKRASKYSDDDSYKGASSDGDVNEDDDSNDDVNDVLDASDDGVVASQRRPGRRATAARAVYKDVDESEIGTADEDSADEATRLVVLLSPARASSRDAAGGGYGSPNARQRARARSGRSPLDVREEGEDESKGSGDKTRGARSKRKWRASSADDGSGSSDKSRSSRRSCSRGKDKGKGKGGSIQHRLLASLVCPSTNHSVTMATLPKNKPHVCYVSPDARRATALRQIRSIGSPSPLGRARLTANHELLSAAPPPAGLPPAS